MSKTYTPDQIPAIVKEQGYKYVCLINSTGKVLEPWNFTPGKLADKLKAINRRLTAPGGEGIYFIEAKHAARNTPDQIPVQKGQVLSEGNPVPPPPITTGALTEHVLTATGAVELKTELVKAQLENDALKRRLEELEKEAEEAEEEEEEPEPEEPEEKSVLSEMGQFAQNIIPSILPAIDKHFEMRQKELELKELELRLKFEQLKNKPDPKKEVKKISYPELLNQLFELKQNDVKSYMYRLGLISENNPEIYERLINDIEAIETQNINENEQD